MGGEVVGEPTLYERIGGIFAIAVVIDDFSDRVVRNQTIIDTNAELHQWHTEAYKTRLPGLKWGENLLGCRSGRRAVPLPRERDARRALRLENLTRNLRRRRG
jgi:hemoglobin